MTRKLVTSLFAAIAALSFALVPTAQAATNPWTWSDISGQLSYTNNRPVWAMAYASPYWFYTDGLDLWNGGQVYRYDGSTQVNITRNVRDAGISRVDDIVSDGQSVLFLKGVVARNNQFEVVKYQNGSYTNLTSTVRSSFASDEGIGQIVGRNGTWYIVTSKGRVLRWSGDSYAPVTVTLPTDLQTNATNSFYNLQSYFQGNFPLGYGETVFTIQPVSGSAWLMVLSYDHYAMSDAYTASNKMYRYDGTNFADITSSFGSYTYAAVASNGTDALVISTSNSYAHWDSQHTSALGYLLVNNSNVRSYSSNVTIRGKAVWTGSNWMVVDDDTKRLVHISEGAIDDLGKTVDYFVTAASNGNGTTLVGGAVSTDALSQPSYPMIAKLVKVTEGAATTNNTDNTTATNTAVKAFGISAWQWTDPNVSSITNNQSVTYNVSAQHASGLNRIEIWVNGSVRKTCTLSSTSANQTCSFTLNGSDYPLNTQVAFNAKVVGRSGEYQAVWTPLMHLNVTDSSNYNNSNTNNTNGYGISAWQALDPNVSTIARDQNVSYTVTAQSPNGLGRIEVYVNGILRRSCSLSSTSANQTCTYAIYGGDYSIGSQVAVNAKVVGTGGDYQAVWTPSTYLTVTDTSYNSNNNNSTNGYGISAWQTLDPNVSTIARNQNVTYTVTAQHPNGLNRAEIYVNGILRRSCALSSTSANQTCTYSIYGGDYAAGTQVTVNAKVVGVSGEYQAVWTPTLTLSVTDTNNSNNNSSNNYGISAWQTLDPNVSTISRSQSVTYNVGAQSANGLNRVEIYVNGSLNRTCSLSSTSANQSCSTSIYGGNYAAGTYVSINAKVVGTGGEYQAVWTPLTYVAIATDAASNNNQTSSQGVSVWQWTDPNVSTIANNQNVTYTVTAQHPNGLNRIEIWVNGSVRQTCSLAQTSSNQTCSYTIYGGNYPVGTQIAFNAKAVGRDGEYQAAWTPLMYLTVTDASGNVTQTTQNATYPTTWIWTIPPDTNLVSSKATYSVGAWDGTDGINRIEIWVNGTVRRTCTFPAIKTNVECDWDVFASDYAAGSEVYVNAKVVDASGNVTWAQSKSWRVQPDGFTAVPTVPQTPPAVPAPAANQQGWVSVASDHDAGYSNGQLITYTATGGDADGVDRIELFVEGARVKVCSGSTCSWTGGPYDGSSTVHYGARLYDKNGYSVWTGYKTIIKR